MNNLTTILNIDIVKFKLPVICFSSGVGCIFEALFFLFHPQKITQDVTLDGLRSCDL